MTMFYKEQASQGSAPFQKKYNNFDPKKKGGFKKMVSKFKKPQGGFKKYDNQGGGYQNNGYKKY